MAVIKASKVSFEVIKQNVLGAAAKYVCKLSYEPIGEQSNELVAIVLANETPYVKMSIENATSVMTLQETGPTLTRPKEIKTPEQLFGGDATVEEMREAYNDAVYQDTLKGRLTPEDKEWQSKK